jgi:hypothetical protein
MTNALILEMEGAKFALNLRKILHIDTALTLRTGMNYP